ncbi:MAG: TraI domain-containing protein [Acidithiobacillus sp.]|nr:TraI domain-containing protein [Acidithiobacillus sp.]
MKNDLRRVLYVLRHLRAGVSRIGQPYCACELLEPGGMIWSAYWWQRFPHPGLWPDGIEVLATVRPRRLGERWLLDIESLGVAALGVSSCGVDLPFPGWLLPLTTQPRLLRELWAQILFLRDPWLRRFNQRILHDPDISVRWVEIPASQRHHHAEPAGLLRHSVEAVRLLSKSPQMSQQEWEIARTALLWHDVGKILAYQGQPRRHAEGFLVQHELATVEVLAPHLAWLRQHAPDLVTALKLHWHTPYRGRPLMPGRILVEACDRTSAALDSREQVFRGEPEWRQLGQMEGPGPMTRYWRLRTPVPLLEIDSP